MRLDEERLTRDVERLHEINNDTVFEALSSTHLRIATNHPQDMLLFTSIPAEPGWRATVNGKSVKTVEVSGGMMAVNVPAGNAVIELKFFPNRLPMGICLTISGIGCLFALHYILKLKKPLEDSAELKDDYDGFDSDYVNVDEVREEFDFDEINKDFNETDET
jgi:uncharacterized membrane protein YfhO